MGKSEDTLKKRVKEAPRTPISLFWIGKSCHLVLARCAGALSALKIPVNYGTFPVGMTC